MKKLIQFAFILCISYISNTFSNDNQNKELLFGTKMGIGNSFWNFITISGYDNSNEMYASFLMGKMIQNRFGLYCSVKPNFGFERFYDSYFLQFYGIGIINLFHNSPSPFVSADFGYSRINGFRNGVTDKEFTGNGFGISLDYGYKTKFHFICMLNGSYHGIWRDLILKTSNPFEIVSSEVKDIAYTNIVSISLSIGLLWP